MEGNQYISLQDIRDNKINPEDIDLGNVLLTRRQFCALIIAAFIHLATNGKLPSLGDVEMLLNPAYALVVGDAAPPDPIPSIDTERHINDFEEIRTLFENEPTKQFKQHIDYLDLDISGAHLLSWSFSFYDEQNVQDMPPLISTDRQYELAYIDNIIEAADQKGNPLNLYEQYQIATGIDANPLAAALLAGVSTRAISRHKDKCVGFEFDDDTRTNFENAICRFPSDSSLDNPEGYFAGGDTYHFFECMAAGMITQVSDHYALPMYTNQTLVARVVREGLGKVVPPLMAGDWEEAKSNLRRALNVSADSNYLHDGAIQFGLQIGTTFLPQDTLPDT